MTTRSHSDVEDMEPFKFMDRVKTPHFARVIGPRSDGTIEVLLIQDRVDHAFGRSAEKRRYLPHLLERV